MLREYQLTNFKAFAGPETIPIRPITLIYGPNSSGKSSILQSLLLLKQTLQEAENSETLLLPKGNLVNLGGYRDFVHRHDVSKPFSFKVILDVYKQELLDVFEKLLPKSLVKTPLLGLQVTFKYEQQVSNIVVDSVEIFVDNDSSPLAIYKTEKSIETNSEQDKSQSDLRRENIDLAETLLKLDNINYEHSFWQAWWEKFGNLLPSHSRNRIAQIFQDLEFHYGRKGWRDRIQHELKKNHNDFKEKLEKTDESSTLTRQELELKLLQTESLIRLWKHFDNYTFEKATEDLTQLCQDSFLPYRNFLPIQSSTTPNNKFQRLLPWSCTGIPLEQFIGLEIWDLPSIIFQRYKPDFSEITSLASTRLKRFLESIVYIGPLRDYPERIYILSGNLNKEVGKSGKMLPDVLFKNPELLKLVNEKLNDFKLGYELKVSSFTDEFSGISDLFALRLIDKDTGVNVSIQDVGFGISQVLPVIVQSMLSRNSTLLIEQPEIHIHPRLQAELGSLFADCIKPPFDNNFIIETHSEHLMLRLQKLIRKGELQPEDIAVIYVDRGSEGSKCLHLRMDEEGDFIDEWPDGFFEEDFNEIFQ